MVHSGFHGTPNFLKSIVLILLRDISSSWFNQHNAIREIKFNEIRISSVLTSFLWVSVEPAISGHHFLLDPSPEVFVLHRQRHHPLRRYHLPLGSRLLLAVGLRRKSMAALLSFSIVFKLKVHSANLLWQATSTVHCNKNRIFSIYLRQERVWKIT